MLCTLQYLIGYLSHFKQVVTFVQHYLMHHSAQASSIAMRGMMGCLSPEYLVLTLTECIASFFAASQSLKRVDISGYYKSDQEAMSLIGFLK